MTRHHKKSRSNKKSCYDISKLCDSDSSSSSCSSSSSSSSCSSSSSSSSCSSSSSSSSCSSSSSSSSCNKCTIKCGKNGGCGRNGGCSDDSCSTPSNSSLISSLSDSSDSTPSSRYYKTDFSDLKSDSSCSSKCSKKSKKCSKKSKKCHKKSKKCESLIKDLVCGGVDTLQETVKIDKYERKHEGRRNKVFNVYFKDCRGHKSGDWCPHNGKAIWIENLLSPNLNLRVGDVCHFNIHQEPNRDGKYENSFVLTESAVSALPNVKVHPLNGFEVAKNGTVSFTVDERTPKHFYYQSANSTCLGGRVFITSQNSARKYRK